jgi:hypothetical protein
MLKECLGCLCVFLAVNVMPQLGVDLGGAVVTLFEIQTTSSWSPDSSCWVGKPELRAFLCDA